jgi:hypothetical protein
LNHKINDTIESNIYDNLESGLKNVINDVDDSLINQNVNVNDYKNNKVIDDVFQHLEINEDDVRNEDNVSKFKLKDRELTNLKKGMFN